MSEEETEELDITKTEYFPSNRDTRSKWGSIIFALVIIYSLCLSYFGLIPKPRGYLFALMNLIPLSIFLQFYYRAKEFKNKTKEDSE